MSDYTIGNNPFYELPQLAMVNALYGRTEDAMNSLYNPNAVGPEGRQTLSRRLGLDNPVLKFVADAASNPLVLVGIALSAVSRLPGVINFMPNVASKDMEGVGLIGGALKGAAGLYKGKETGDIARMLYRGANRTADFQQGTGKLAAAAVEAHRLAVGGNIDAAEDLRMGYYLTNLVSGHTREQASFRRVLNRKPSGLGLSREEAAEFNRMFSATEGLPVVEGSQYNALRQNMNHYFERVFERVFGNPEFNRTILRKAKAHGIDVSGRDLIEGYVKKQVDYFPRLNILSESEQALLARKYMMDNASKVGIHTTMDDIERRAMTASSAHRVSQSTARRSGFSLPNPDHLEAVGANPRLVELIRKMVAHREQAGKPIHLYSLSFKDVLTKYSDGMGRTYAWHTPLSNEAPDLMSSLLKEGVRLTAKNTPQSKYLATSLTDVYLPLAMGHLTPSQGRSALTFDAMRQSVVDALAPDSMLGRALGKVAPRHLEQLRNTIATDRFFSYTGLGDAISSGFYTSTLAGFSPGIWNSLQSLATTIPTVGVKTWVEGVGEVGRRMANVLDDMAKNKVPFKDAFTTHFAEFVNMHQELEPLVRAFESDTERGILKFSKMPGGIKGALLKGQRIILAPFAGSEMFNRLTTFYAVRSKAVKELKGTTFKFLDRAEPTTLESAVDIGEAANEVAMFGTGALQFGSGYLNKPRSTLQVWSPGTQFTSFPMRMLDYAGFAARNPGVLGRVLTGAGLAYTAGKQLGFDPERGLFFGGLPLPEEGQVLSPLPVVPPLLQVGASAALSVATGDSRYARQQIPLLVPGGVAAAKAIGMLPFGAPAAQAIDRPYADYNQTLPDGRVAVYSRQGALIGYFTRSQLFLNAMGIKPRGMAAESELSKFIMNQRDAVRGIKQEAMAALYNNDIESVAGLSAEYSRKFPGVGPLPISKSDIRSLEAKREISRVERLLETLPSNLRPQYAAVVANTIPKDIMALTRPLETLGNTMRSRDPYRESPTTRPASVRPAGQPSMHGVKLTDKMARLGMSRDPNGELPYNSPTEYNYAASDG